MPITLPPIPPAPQATLTTADGAASGVSRVDTIVDRYLDASLHDFRQLRVWDEHARRSGDDGLTLRATYRPWNREFVPEVYGGDNRRVAATAVAVDYDRGFFTVAGDDGDRDWFVTYEFNAFPADDLRAMLDQTLAEINATAEPDTHLTMYRSVAETPAYWDGPLAAGVLAKCFRRLASDGTLWRNWLIWQDGAAGQQAAREAATEHQAAYDELRKSVKRRNYIAQATEAYAAFEFSGFGGLGNLFNAGGGRWRGLKVNRLPTY